LAADSLNSAARNMEMAAMTESKLPNGNSHAAKTYKARISDCF
jgi:hypothetical protein